MNIRQSIEEKEKLILNEKACLSINSKGRERAEPGDDIRTVL